MVQNVVSAINNDGASEALRLELSTIESLVNYHAWVYREIQPYLGDQLIEIGGGLGTFSDLIVNHHILANPTGLWESWNLMRICFCS